MGTFAATGCLARGDRPVECVGYCAVADRRSLPLAAAVAIKRQRLSTQAEGKHRPGAAGWP